MFTAEFSRQGGAPAQTAQGGGSAMGKAVHSWLPYWLAACGHGVDLSSSRELKLALKQHGIHAQGLRIYRTHGDPMFAALGPSWIRRDCPMTSLRAAVALLRLLQDAHVEAGLPVGLIRTAAEASGSLQRFEQFPVALFRAAWREVVRSVKSGTAVEAALAERIAPILSVALTEWLRDPPDHNQAKRGWAWVRKNFGLRALARAEPRGRREWNTPFTRARFGGLDFLPLFNVDALEQEGEQMEHCIADYFKPRALGRTHHAFSIRQPRTGERVATMSLVRDEAGLWVLDGLSGRCNEYPGKEATKAAEAFTVWMNRKKRTGGS